MRHAESTYNRYQLDVAASLGKDPSYEEEANRWINDPKIVDALLSGVGEQQCEEAQKKIRESYPNIKYVFVSPMRRASLTAILSLKDYPGQLEWRALPWFREIMLSQCDIGYYCLDMLKEYPFIDISSLKDNRLWFMDYYDNTHDPQDHCSKVKQLYAEKPCLETLIAYFKENFPNMESASQMYYRVDRTLADLKQFISDKAAAGTPVKDDEILLVSHSRIIRYLHGAFDLEGNLIPEKDAYFKNAEIRPFDIKI